MTQIILCIILFYFLILVVGIDKLINSLPPVQRTILLGLVEEKMMVWLKISIFVKQNNKAYSKPEASVQYIMFNKSKVK